MLFLMGMMMLLFITGSGRPTSLYASVPNQPMKEITWMRFPAFQQVRDQHLASGSLEDLQKFHIQETDNYYWLGDTMLLF